MKNFTKNRNNFILVLLALLTSLTMFSLSSLLFESGTFEFEMESKNGTHLIVSYYNNSMTPIYIDGDAQGVGAQNWTWAASQPWCTGNGTESEPYIIANITIDGQFSGSCIEIRDSVVFFKIENCTILNSGSSGNFGIGLNQVQNGTIFKNQIYNNLGRAGIYVSTSNFNNISGNLCLNNSGYGILLESSNDNFIQENNCSINTGGIILGSFSIGNLVSGNNCSDNYIGITIQNSSNNTLSNNTLVGCGIATQAHNNNIDISNKINGKSVRYYENQKGIILSDEEDVGQVILVNCSDSLIQNLEISKTTMGIQLYYSNNNTISSNNFSDNNYGIELEFSHYNAINGNNCSNNNDMGIILFVSNFTKISENICDNNIKEGIYLYSSYYCEVNQNNCSENNAGILLYAGSNKNIISENTLLNNNEGISLYNVHSFYSCKNNTIYNNKIQGNNLGISLYSEANFNLIYLNIMINNGINALDNGTNNQWDNGSLGNYWDNYTGEDWDDDGIGDSSYDILGTAGAQDSYPIWDDGSTIKILSPYSGGVFGAKAPDYSVEISGDDINTTWYSLGAQNFTFTGNGTINQTVWDSFSEGPVSIRFYANDSLGNLVSESLSVLKDITIPNISILTPIEDKLFNSTAPSFIVEISDFSLNTTWYSMNGKNKTFSSNGTFSETEWDLLPDGPVSITFYANDTAGNIASQSVSIAKDGTLPNIKILSPIADGTFGSTAPSFIVEISDTLLSSTWYSMNGKNITFSSNGTFSETEWDLLPDGPVSITFYANDTAGNIASQSITIVKDTTPQNGGNGISSFPTPLIITTVLIMVISLVFYYQKTKKVRDL
ncbi:MAG: hypothetical protein GF317_15820 [Candidatus Lokiarchaeota archaeon]|nr:hypothetical protein [Candidatus Lokiarchaeota archaeon]MBD3201018.1 hypothetical protein [Candidatus Lokiarchaeota archaeon]